MKGFRRWLCAVIAALYACAMGSPICAAEKPEEFDVLMDARFDDRNEQVWDKADGLHTFRAVDQEHGYSMAMRLATDVELCRYFREDQVYPLYVVSFDTRTDYPYVQSYLRLLGSDDETWNAQHTYKTFYMSLVPGFDWCIGYYDGSVGSSCPEVMKNREYCYQMDRWYHVDMWLDMENHAAMYYFDGKYVGQTGIPEDLETLRGLSYAGLKTQSGIYNLNENTQRTAEVYIDNFKVRGVSNTEDLQSVDGLPAPDDIRKPLRIEAECGAGNISFENIDIPFDVRLVNKRSRPMELTLKYKALTQDNRSLWELEEQVVFNSKAAVNKRISIDKRCDYGFYRFLIEAYDKEGRRLEMYETRFSVVNSPADGVKNHRIGFTNHLSEEQHMGDPAVKIPQQAKMGNFITRDELFWSSFVPKEGVYQTNDRHEQWSNLAKENGMDSLLVLSFSNPAVSVENPPRSPEAIEKFAEYAYHLALQEKGRCQYFEVWNEYNAKFSAFNRDGGTPEDYANLLKACYIAVKKANPEAKVIGIVSARLDVAFTKGVLDAGGADYMDILSFHPYPYNYAVSPEVGLVEETTRQLRELMDDYGMQQTPLWVSEIGYSSGPGYCTELQQAAYTVRTAFLLHEHADAVLYYGATEKVGQGNLENHFGFTRPWIGVDVVDEAKPAFLALANYNALMSDDALIERLPVTDDGVYVFRHKLRDGRQAIAAWAAEGSRTVGIKTGSQQAELYDLYGNARSISALDGAFQLYLDDMPVYLVGNFTECEKTQAIVGFDVDGTFAIAGGDVKTLAVTTSAQDTLEIGLELPDNITVDSSGGFENGRAALKLKAGLKPTENAAMTVTLQKDGRLYCAADIAVNYTPAAEASFLYKPYKNGRWQGVLSVKNLCDSVALSGTMEILAPSGLAELIPLQSFEPIGVGRTATLTYNLPDSQMADEVLAAGQIVLSNGAIIPFGGNYRMQYITYTKTPPTIDGELTAGEWNARPMLLDAENQYIKIDGNGLEGWQGTADLSAKAYVMMDAENLYLAAEVTDDAAGFDTDGNLWAGDAVQFGVSTGREPLSKQSEITVGIMDGKTRAIRYMHLGNSVTEDLTDHSELEFQVVRRDTVTTYEMKVPFSELMPEGTSMARADRICFSLLVNDNDGAGRKGWLEYGSGIGRTKNPTLYLELPVLRKISGSHK